MFAKEQQLYQHMKHYHKKQALEDGIIDYSDEEFLEAAEKKDTKVKIISDISLPTASPLIKLERSPEAAAVRTMPVAMSTTTTSVRMAETKFVTADGNELILNAEQRKEIMSQLNQQEHGGSVLMVLNENLYPVESSAATNEIAQNTVIQQQDVEEEARMEDSNIYTEFLTQHKTGITIKKTKTTAAMHDAKETLEHLEWAENLISEQELAEEAAVANEGIEQQKARKDEDVSRKLKELTGDWSEDENEDEEFDDGKLESSTIKTEMSSTDMIQEEHLNESFEEKEPKEEESIGTIIEQEKIEKDDKASDIKEKPDIISSECKPTEEVNEDDIDLAMKSMHKDDFNDSAEMMHEEVETHEEDEHNNEKHTHEMEKDTEYDDEEEEEEKMEIDEEDANEKVVTPKEKELATENAEVTKHELPEEHEIPKDRKELRIPSSPIELDAQKVEYEELHADPDHEEEHELETVGTMEVEEEEIKHDDETEEAEHENDEFISLSSKEMRTATDDNVRETIEIATTVPSVNKDLEAEITASIITATKGAEKPKKNRQWGEEDDDDDDIEDEEEIEELEEEETRVEDDDEEGEYDDEGNPIEHF